MPLSGEAKQVLATLCVNLLSCGVGASMGWASSAIKFLETVHSDLLTGSLTPAESGLINSMYCVGGLIGSLIYGFINDKIGRKNSITTAAIPQIISFVLVATAKNSLMILLSRVCIGFCVGSLFISLPLFVSEISEDVIRGTMGSLFVLLVGAGVCFGYVLGAFMHYKTCVLVYFIFPVLYLILQNFLHETPFYLVMKDKFDEAEKSIMFYRGVTKLEGNSAIEFQTLKRFVKSDDGEEKVSLSDFQTKAAIKSIFIGIILVWLEQFCGCFALLFYTASVFEESGATSIAPEIATIIVGVIQLIGAYSSTFMVDKAGRKVLVCFSAYAVAFGMIVFGAATQLIEYGYRSTFIKIIPVFALSFSVFVANVGVFTMTFVILAEICPSKVKSYIFTMCMILGWIFTFAVFNLISPLVAWLGPGGIMYFFAFCSVVGGSLILRYMPETMGKTMDQIQEELSN